LPRGRGTETASDNRDTARFHSYDVPPTFIIHNYASVNGVYGMQPQGQPSTLWNQPHYRVRKKVASIATKYFIEDANGNMLGFTKQKMMKLKEDIRIYTDKKMKQELFQIRQTQIVDTWGNYAVMDTASGQCVGNIKRMAGKSMLASEYMLLDAQGQQIGRIFEEAGKGAMRRFMPGGNLIPQKVFLEFGGQVCGEIKQKFKIIGDIWEADASCVPPHLDRRVLIGAMLMMSMIERKK